MMKKRHSKSVPSHPRAGLAPLELVLFAPFLLLMGALMICFSDASLFKIRAQTAAHYAATQTESLRNSNYALSATNINPQPDDWPEPGTIQGEEGGRLQNLPQTWNVPNTNTQGRSNALQGNLQEPVFGKSLRVNRKFVMENGMRRGRVRRTRQFPMLQRILSDDGNYRVNHEYDYLQGDWDYGNIGHVANQPYSGNVRTDQWRANTLYDISLMPQEVGAQNLDNFLALKRALANLQALTNKNDTTSRNVDDLDALDADWEWLDYHSSWPPNFHPHPSGCVDSFEEYRDSGQLRNFLRRIQRVPRRMATTWRDVYDRELRNRQTIVGYIPLGPYSDAELEQKIRDHDFFLQSLPPGY
ncbi:MAG: hypothetical protein HUJ26_12390 [Planctomycetaceae bacterium]|nr:hypothetical protein [Planctomycetaceae bacterium]